MYYIFIYLLAIIYNTHSFVSNNTNFQNGKRVPYGTYTDTIFALHTFIYSLLLMCIIIICICICLGNCISYPTHRTECNKNIIALIKNVFCGISAEETTSEHKWPPQNSLKWKTRWITLFVEKEEYSCTVIGENLAFSLKKIEFNRHGQ